MTQQNYGLTRAFVFMAVIGLSIWLLGWMWTGDGAVPARLFFGGSILWVIAFEIAIGEAKSLFTSYGDQNRGGSRNNKNS